jgi:hypothetical protein
MGSSQYVPGLGLILPECPRPKPADEIKLAEPLNYFIAQASATIEAGTPTLYSAARGKSRGRGYSRILLPAWGNGRIDLLLGAVI